MNLRIIAGSSCLLLLLGCSGSGERAESEATLFVASNEAIFESGIPQGPNRAFFRYIYDQSKCNLKIKPTYHFRVGKDFKKFGVIELKNSDQTAGIPATDEVLGESAFRQIRESWPQSLVEQASRKTSLPIADIELLVKTGGYSKTFLISQDAKVVRLLKASASATESPLKGALILSSYSEYVGTLAKHYCGDVPGGAATPEQNNFLLIFLGPESSETVIAAGPDLPASAPPMPSPPVASSAPTAPPAPTTTQAPVPATTQGASRPTVAPKPAVVQSPSKEEGPKPPPIKWKPEPTPGRTATAEVVPAQPQPSDRANPGGTCAQAIAELKRMLRSPKLEDGLPSNKFIEIKSRSDCSNVQRQESSEICEASIRGSNENLAQFNCSPAS